MDTYHKEHSLGTAHYVGKMQGGKAGGGIVRTSLAHCARFNCVFMYNLAFERAAGNCGTVIECWRCARHVLLWKTKARTGLLAKEKPPTRQATKVLTKCQEEVKTRLAGVRQEFPAGRRENCLISIKFMRNLWSKFRSKRNLWSCYDHLGSCLLSRV